MNGTVGFIVDPKLLIRRRKEWQEVVLTILLQFCANARDFFAVRIGRVGFVEYVVLFILHVYTPEAILEIFTECTEATVRAEVCIETEVTHVAGRTVDALIGPLQFKTMREVAAILKAIRLDTVETILERKRVVALVAITALSKVIANTIFATELMQCEIRRMFLHILLSPE